MKKKKDQKKQKILLGVAEGDFYARMFVTVAETMPEVEFRMVGFSWSTGRAAREAGVAYAHMPFRARIGVLGPVSPVAEFTSRGHTNLTVPVSARRAFTAFSVFLEAQVDEFQPDLVVYGPIDHSVCFLLDKIAQERGVARIGLQPSFLSNRFIVQTCGPGWVERIRGAQLPEYHLTQAKQFFEKSVMPRRVSGSKSIWSKHLWMRGVESALRVVTGGSTFDTCKSLGATFTSWAAPRRWFPELETLQNSGQLQRKYVLVVLHQPVLFPWGSPTWLDLINFALASIPDEMAVILRAHPAEPAVRLPKGLLAKLLARGAQVSRVEEGPGLTEVIRNCRAMMTLNSSMGIEGLLAGVPVLTLAPAYYTREGLAVPVFLSEAHKIKEALRVGELQGPDRTTVERFTCWLIHEHMVHSPLSPCLNENGLQERICRSLADQQRGV